MSDSSDIDWDDDDTLLEQRKQELLQQHASNTTNNNRNDDGPTAHPAFLAQFDPKSPTYHGGHDAKPIMINSTGAMSVPRELQGQYGAQITSLHDLPDAPDDAPPLVEDPAVFGPTYKALWNLREGSLGLKKLFHRFQTLVAAYIRAVEVYDCKIPHTPPAAESYLPHMTPQGVTRKEVRAEIRTAREVLSSFMKDLGKRSTALRTGLTDPTLVAARITGANLVNYNLPQHLSDLEGICGVVEGVLFANELKDHDKILAAEHDLYYQMKVLSTALTTEQGKMLQELKAQKKLYIEKKKAM